MPYTLAYKDRYLRVEESSIESDTSDSIAFASIPDDVPTRLVTEWTGKQFTKLFSAVFTGAHLMFPDDAAEIIWQLLKVVHQPLPLDPDGDCVEYLPSAPFIKFYPDNPYIDGDNKDGWWREAWFQWEDFFSLFPEFAADWLGGVVGGFVGYQNTDILCNIASLAYPTWGAFFDAGGVFPKIQIKVFGSGQVNLQMLSFPLGGKAIISIDSEPDIFDILSGGILDPSSFMMELNRDILSFPPQEYPLVVMPIKIEDSGAHTIYIHFIPTINDETTFLGFGGGFRGVELCGFSEVGEVGIEQIFWDGCALKIITGGVESTVVSAEEIQACMDIPDGGGSGSAVFSTQMHVWDIGANVTNNTQSFATALSVSFTPTKPNFIALVKNLTLSNSAGGAVAEVRLRYNGVAGGKSATIEAVGTTGREASIDDYWLNQEVGVAHTFAVEMRSETASNTATLGSGLDQMVTFLEWDSAEDLFVQDVQYVDGVLQKKIGGLWFDVVDIEAILAPIQSLAAAANSAAAAAQTSANSAIATNSAQQTTINNHATRITNLEDTLEEVVTLDLPQINLTIADHESRIDALESAPSGGGDWAGETLGKVSHLFSSLNPAGGVYAIQSGSYQTSPVAGLQADSGGDLHFTVDNAMKFGSVAFVEIQVLVIGSPPPDILTMRINNGVPVRMDAITIGVNDYFRGYAAVDGNEISAPSPIISDTMKIHIEEDGGLTDETKWRVIGVKYLCIEVDPFTGTLFP